MVETANKELAGTDKEAQYGNTNLRNIGTNESPIYVVDIKLVDRAPAKKGKKK